MVTMVFALPFLTLFQLAADQSVISNCEPLWPFSMAIILYQYQLARLQVTLYEDRLEIIEGPDDARQITNIPLADIAKVEIGVGKRLTIHASDDSRVVFMPDRDAEIFHNLIVERLQ